jgi:hypothetical protein
MFAQKPILAKGFSVWPPMLLVLAGVSMLLFSDELSSVLAKVNHEPEGLLSGLGEFLVVLLAGCVAIASGLVWFVIAWLRARS